MDSDDDSQEGKTYHDQPYDESLDIPDNEEVPSVAATPNPGNPFASKASRGQHPVKVPEESDDDEDDEDDEDEDDHGGNAHGNDWMAYNQPRAGAQPEPKSLYRDNPKAESSAEDDDDDDDEDDMLGVAQQRSGLTAIAPRNPADIRKGALRPPGGGGGGGAVGGDEGESSDDEDDEDDDEDTEHAQIEGAYDPTEYENLPVPPEIKELFQYIVRFTPQNVELDHKLKPFIPDYIPAVGDIDAMVKIPRPDKKPDTLGLTVLDEPCAKQSDPTVLDLQLRAFSKQTTTKQASVKSIANVEKNPKAITSWIESIGDLHRLKPPATVHYTKPMPDVDTLMAEWPPEVEEMLKEIALPNADADCDLETLADMSCALLDIPVYKSRVQSLHVLFSVYSEFKNSQHFRQLAEANQMNNRVKKTAADDDHFLM